MSADLMELGRRAVACKGWRWMPGMVVLPFPYRVRVVQFEPGAVAGTGVRMLPTGGWALALVQCDDLPDLTDPATLGCLLALVREAWGPAYGTGRPHLRPTATGWFVASCGYPVAPEGLTEAEALVAALECAP